MLKEDFLEIGEYGAAGLYEEVDRGLFYRKALGLRRYFENCDLAPYGGELLYPSGVLKQSMSVAPNYYYGLSFDNVVIRKKAPDLAEKLREEFGLFV